MERRDSAVNHGPLALAWLTGGVFLAAMFSTGQLPPLVATVPLLGVLSIVAMLSLKVTELSVMSRLFVLLFSLPFGATVGYLFDKDYVWWATPTNILLCQNHLLVNQMLMMVVVGLCGLIFGIELMAANMATQRRRPVKQIDPASIRSLPLLPVWVLLAIAFVLSWLHAPTETILVAQYASDAAGGGLDKDTGLNSSYLISYLILILLWVDSERDPRPRIQFLKRAAFAAVLGYIVVFLQLLRGDRECAGLVAALGMLYITDPTKGSLRSRFQQQFQQIRRAMTLIAPLTACMLVFLALGAVRHTASEKSTEKTSIGTMIAEGATQNTWTAVALNNLGLAADYNFDTLEYLYGRTYVDYILSLPPGAVTKVIGYERPLEGDANPAMWYFGLIAAGGMHPVVVPFRNMGIWGVLFMLTLCGCFICYTERNNETGTMSGRMLYGCVATSSMLWFWYGDMNMIRTVMGWAILCGLHQLLAVKPRKGQLKPKPLPSIAPRPQLVKTHNMAFRRV